MKAIQYQASGGPEVLEVVDVPEPHAAANQIRVAVKAVGVNPADWKSRRGLMGGELPRGTGSEVAGVVDEVGARSAMSLSATACSDPPGTALRSSRCWSTTRRYRRRSTLPALRLTVAVETATRTLDLLGVGDGQTLLVNGAAGAVGIGIVQLAREPAPR